MSGERQKPLQKPARWSCGVCGRGVPVISKAFFWNSAQPRVTQKISLTKTENSSSIFLQCFGTVG